ncbi:MAG: selenoneine synthase SenA [Polyangiaceae bacterium]
MTAQPGVATIAVVARDLVEELMHAKQRIRGALADLQGDALDPPPGPTHNPLRWELGHVAFFWDHFFLRELGRADYLLDDAETLYDSFDVAHDERWGLRLPSRDETFAYLDRVVDAVAERLASIGDGEDARAVALHGLALCHADMHREALVMTRQTLGHAAPPDLASPSGADLTATGELTFPSGHVVLGPDADAIYAFDNERPPHEREVGPFAIDAGLVSNRQMLAFVEAGGYARREWWTRQGWVWRSRQARRMPRYWHRLAEDGWLEQRFDRLVPLDLDAPAQHLSWYEAMAYCRFAGRRLPSEAEWVCAARSGRGVGFFGQVWQWTADPFYPFPGYVVGEPYREYSAPWFGYRKVLKGGSHATPASLVRLGYRNFFTPERDDVIAGLRTCAGTCAGTCAAFTP